jgi:hypothetical protein
VSQHPDYQADLVELCNRARADASLYAVAKDEIERETDKAVEAHSRYMQAHRETLHKLTEIEATMRGLRDLAMTDSAATDRADALEKVLEMALDALNDVALYHADAGRVVARAAAAAKALVGPDPECSVCRRRHGPEVQHASE